MDMVDMLIHVHSDLSVEQRTGLEEILRDCNGVLSVHFSLKHPHLLAVEYDPAAIDSGTLLKRVRAQGVVANRIGL